MQTPFEQMTRDQQILAWDAAKKELDALKEREMFMRKHIVNSVEGVDTSVVGTQNVDLGNGWKLKAVIKESYKLDTDADKVEDALDALEDWQADRLVKWTPTMSVSEYKKLDPEAKAAIDAVLTVSMASPTLSLVPPKGA